MNRYVPNDCVWFDFSGIITALLLAYSLASSFPKYVAKICLLVLNASSLRPTPSIREVRTIAC